MQVASVTQEGAEHSADIRSNGLQNEAYIDQSGSLQTASIFQDGTANSADSTACGHPLTLLPLTQPLTLQVELP